MKIMLVGFYNVEHVGNVAVETELTGDPEIDRAKLDGEVARSYSGSRFVRRGSRIEERGALPEGVIEYSPGQTLAQLFDGTEENQLPIGSVVWRGELCEIKLLLSRIRNEAGIVLRSGHSVSAIFSRMTTGDERVEELPYTIARTLGKEGTQLSLKVKVRV